MIEVEEVQHELHPILCDDVFNRDQQTIIELLHCEEAIILPEPKNLQLLISDAPHLF